MISLLLLGCGLAGSLDWAELPIGEGAVVARGKEVLWVIYERDREPQALAERYRNGLLKGGWVCSPLQEVTGHGWVSECDLRGRPHKLLSVSKLPQRVLVSLNNAHSSASHPPK